MPRAATHAARAATATPPPGPAKRAAPSRRDVRAGSAAHGAGARRSTVRASARPVAGIAHAGGAVVRFPSPTRLLDRLHPSRVWVGLVGALLVGIVFFNVSLLELNGGIARTSERVMELKRQNSDLRLEVARLGSTERIERRAAALGFYLPKPNDVTYLEAEPEADGRAAAETLDGAIAAAPVEAAPVE